MDLSRRDVLKLAVAGSAAGLASCVAPKEEPAVAKTPAPNPSRMPVVLVSHGSPMVAITKDDYAQAMKWMGEDLPLPKSIVVVSAHWQEDKPIRVTAGEKPQTIYDFGGFPDKLYQLKYPSPGNPALAGEIVQTLAGGGFPARLEDRGLDHGAWIPMIMTFPGAEIPVIEVTLQHGMTPQEYLKLGRLLAPLRERGTLIVGSGGVVHSNPEMRRLKPGEKTDAWAVKFDTWFRDRIGKGDFESIANYREAHPEGARAAPTTEHFDPIFVALGAAVPGDRVVDVYEGFRGANLSMRTFTLRS
jgi:4,5-DOPA dioxygenase extradiol